MALVAARKIRPAGTAAALFVEAWPHGAGTMNVARRDDGDCVFFDREDGRRCVIHRDAGPEALPTACRHFPRRMLRDDRGTFISLSHFCPTAAAMLFTPDTLDVEEAHPPLRLEEPVEGMDAVGALPPLVRPGVLSDLDGYSVWERHCLAVFSRRDLDYQQALDLVAAATERVRGWRPGGCRLATHVHTAFEGACVQDGVDKTAQARAMGTLRSLCEDRVSNDLAPIEGFDDHWTRLAAPSFEAFDVAMKNYLAARLFANWIAYQGRGLRSIVEWLRTCAALVRHHALRRALDSGTALDRGDFIEAIRMADLLLLHLIDTQAFATQVAFLEGPDPR